MTAKEYFGDYWNCFDKQEFSKVMKKVQELYKTKKVYPTSKNIFKAFELCPYKELKVIFLGQDPYPQKDVATGLAFANKADTKVLSPSLEIIKESVINFEKPHNFITFAPDLEEWAKQGVLLLNSALTVEMNKIGSHTNLWRPFISSFLYNLSVLNPGLIYVLLGGQAQTFEHYIGNRGLIIKTGHPSFYARTHTKMPYEVFTDIDNLVRKHFDTKIIWYNEYGKQENQECYQEGV